MRIIKHKLENSFGYFHRLINVRFLYVILTPSGPTLVLHHVGNKTLLASIVFLSCHSRDNFTSYRTRHTVKSLLEL